MSRKEQSNSDAAKRIGALNEIFEDVISDASELIDDLYRGVRTYLVFGIITILFGVSELAYNAEILQERYYIPLFLAGLLMFAGARRGIKYMVKNG